MHNKYGQQGGGGRHLVILRRIAVPKSRLFPSVPGLPQLCLTGRPLTTPPFSGMGRQEDVYWDRAHLGTSTRSLLRSTPCASHCCANLS